MLFKHFNSFKFYFIEHFIETLNKILNFDNKIKRYPKSLIISMLLQDKLHLINIQNVYIHLFLFIGKIYFSRLVPVLFNGYAIRSIWK